MTKTKKTKSVDVKPYIASIKVLGKVYTAKGESVREAIENLKPEGATKGTSILSLSKGDASKDRILPYIQTFRLFSPSKLMREIALKNVSLLFDKI